MKNEYKKNCDFTFSWFSCSELALVSRVFCTKLGSGGADDLLFTENDASCCVDITSTKDGKFITINSNSRTSSEEGHISNISFLSSKIKYKGPRSFLGPHILIMGSIFISLQVYVIDAMNVKDGLWPVRKRVPGVQYFLEHHYGFFYILTNAPSRDMVSAVGSYHLARCRAEKSLLARWQVKFFNTHKISL